MANTKFDSKSFNPQAFKYSVDRVPRTRLNEMRKSRALAGNPDIRDVFSSQSGTAYARDRSIDRSICLTSVGKIAMIISTIKYCFSSSVRFVCAFQRRKGNRVEVPSDPVTVNREHFHICHCVNYTRRRVSAAICEPGNLLDEVC